MKIAVVGSINMDMTVTAERIPLKGETLYGSDLHYIPGGKGANQAVAMAKLGADITMFGCVGDDANGQVLIDNMKNAGVKTEHIQIVEGVPTGIALITVGDNDNTIIVVAGANAHVTVDYVKSIREKLLTYDLVVLQQEIPAETITYIVDFCYENKIKTVLNPAPFRMISKEMIEKVTYLTPNEHEAALLFGNNLSTEEILKKYPEKLIITQGSKGVSTGLKDGRILTVPARKANVVDTTGAGDTLNGAFSVKLVEGASMEEALKFANTAASLSTERFGAQGGMPLRADVEKELEAMKK